MNNARSGGRSWTIRAGGLGAIAVALILAMIGCTRSNYRSRADRDVYDIQDERAIDPRWQLPRRPVEADTKSRIGDSFNPDAEPIPLDDGAARVFQATNGRSHEFHSWEKRGLADVESDDWRLCLSTDKDGAVVLDRDSVIRLALLNSRDYQLSVEQLYETALTLTLARYEFYLQPFARQGTFFNQIGGGASARNQLDLNQRAGFTQNFASGGQLLVDFANAMVFNFNGSGVSSVTSNLGVTFAQPLIRGAFARFRTQALSLQERQTLYAVRDFARFRRQFYVTVVAGDGYLGLLQSLQNIRNQEQNVRTLARNLEEQDELVRAGALAQKDRDFVAQNYQASQVTLVGLTAGLETQLDAYKNQLGLPTELSARLDDSPLKIFELSNPKIDDLRKINEALFLSLLQPETAPPREVLASAAEALARQLDDLEPIYVQVEGELRQWRTGLNLLDENGDELPLPTPTDRADDPLATRQRELADRVRTGLLDSRSRLKSNRADLAEITARLRGSEPSDPWGKLRKYLGKEGSSRDADIAAEIAANLRAGEPSTPWAVVRDLAGRESSGRAADLLDGVAARLRDEEPSVTWARLRDLVGKEYNARIADVLVAQTQARVFLIKLADVSLSSEEAVRLGLENRLDLMNTRARVTDAWRNEELAANRLLADVNVIYTGNLGTDPKHDGIFRFDSSNSSHRIGIQFDAPLVRRIERNVYRSSQIDYQRARRAWMANRDLVVRELRLDIRQLNLNKAQFEIGREQLVTAARRVEEAESEQRFKRTLESSNTILLLQALQALVDAKNGLIDNWVNYQTSRMNLYRDLDLMDIDARGTWLNERDTLSRTTPDGSDATPAQPPPTSAPDALPPG